jgi:iron complex transport system substrate-binding protein
VQFRLLTFFLAPLLMLGVACSGGGDGPAQGSSGSLEFRGSDGVMVRLEAPPQRIVSLAPHATEIFCAIDAGDRLAAVDKFASCPLDSKSKPEVDSFQPSIEAIAGYRPDLVYMFYDPGEIAAGLRRLNIPVLLLDVPDDLDGVFENIELIGRMTGKETAAKKLIDDMKSRRDRVVESVRGVASGPRIFHEISPDFYTVRNDTFEGSLYQMLKAENIARNAASSYPQLSSEAIVQANPQVIVVVHGETPASVRARPGWSGIAALRDNRVCEMDPDVLSRPGPRIIDGFEALAECLYPGR